MINDISDYLEDILRNKSMIKEMINTNVIAYENKIESNNLLIEELKKEICLINSDFQIVENKLKLEYAKCYEQFQKHEINYRLLDKTNSHYKMLIKEREEEIRKLEEQIIFAYQDYQNKKVKLDCVNVQIIEAEFQLSNLQKIVEEKINKIKDEEKLNFEMETCSQPSAEYTNTQKNKSREIDKLINEKLEYNSSYTYNKNKSTESFKTQDINKIFDKNQKSEMFDAITINSKHLKKNNCVII